MTAQLLGFPPARPRAHPPGTGTGTGTGPGTGTGTGTGTLRPAPGGWSAPDPGTPDRSVAPRRPDDPPAPDAAGPDGADWPDLAGALLLLEAMRHWADGARSRTCPLHRVAALLLEAGQGRLIAPLDALMRDLANGAARPLRLLPAGSAAASADERVILAALLHAGQGAGRPARDQLIGLVRADALAMVLHRMILLAAGRGTAGWAGLA